MNACRISWIKCPTPSKISLMNFHKSNSAYNKAVYNCFIDKCLTQALTPATPVSLKEEHKKWLTQTFDTQKITALFRLLQIKYRLIVCGGVRSTMLTNDTLKHIFTFLDVYSVYGTLARVSKQFNQCANETRPYFLSRSGVEHICDLWRTFLFTCNFCKERKYAWRNARPSPDTASICPNNKCNIHPGMYVTKHIGYIETGYWSCCNQLDYMSGYNLSEMYKLKSRYDGCAAYPTSAGCVRACCRATKYPSNVLECQANVHERVLRLRQEYPTLY